MCFNKVEDVNTDIVTIGGDTPAVPATWEAAEIDRTLLEIDQEAIDFAKAKGHQFFELSPEDLNKLFSFVEEMALNKAAALDAQGLPGTKIFQETRRLIKQYVM